MDHHSCWHCGVADAASPFCNYCNSLQSPGSDYFTFFGLPKKLSIDTADLQQRFYRLSRLLHPDRYTRSSPREQQYSLEATSILNDGYRTLRDAARRAEYILREQGLELGQHNPREVPPELLEEVFDLNMQIDELRSGDEDARQPLQDSRGRFTSMLEETDGRLLALFSAYDAAAGRDDAHRALLDIRSVLTRRRYIRNLLGEVDKALTARDA
jgi:molecular chaperone HscB